MTPPSHVSPADPDVGGSPPLPDETGDPRQPGTSPGPSGSPAALLSPRRRRRGVVVLCVTAVLVVAVVGCLAYRAWDAGVESDLDRATGLLGTAVLELDDAVRAGELVLADSEGRVGDDQVRVDLASAISGVDELSWALPDGSRQARTVAADGLAGQARTHVSALDAATGLVVAAVDAFDLEQAVAAETQAAERLAVSVTDARTTLGTTEGQVPDNAVREDLAAALGVAEALKTVDVDQTLAVAQQAVARTASAADLTRTSDSLDEARRAVVDAQAVWQADQDRIAAEQERLALEQTAVSRPDAPASSSSSGSGSPKSKSTGGTKAPATSGKSPVPSAPAPAPAPAPVPAPDSGYTTETQTGTWCDSFDTSGAEGTGGWC